MFIGTIVGFAPSEEQSKFASYLIDVVASELNYYSRDKFCYDS